MMKKRNLIIITLLIVSCWFTGCNKGDDSKEPISTEKDNAITSEQGTNVENEQESNGVVDINSLIGVENTSGNSIGNLNEYGLLAKQGDWIYFNDSEVDMFRKETVDGTEREILADCNPYFINVVGEWIYYCEWSDKSLWKMKIDGSEMQQLLDDYVDYVYVEDDWIYYKGEEDNNNILYRMHLDGSDNEKIFGDAYCVYDGRIYYQKEIENYEYQLCSISIQGNDEIVLVDGRVSYLNVDGDWIYYRGDDEGHCLYKMKIDGTEKTRLINTSASDIITWEEWIYFISYDDDSYLESDMIYRIKKDGSTLQCAKNIHKVEEYNVVEGKVRHIHSNNHREYFYSFEEACFLEVEMEQNTIPEAAIKEYKAIPISYLFVKKGQEPEGAWVYELLIENGKLKISGSLDVIIEGEVVERTSDDEWTFKLAENIIIEGVESYGDLDTQIEKFNEMGDLYALKAQEFFFRVENDEVTYISIKK